MCKQHFKIKVVLCYKWGINYFATIYFIVIKHSEKQQLQSVYYGQMPRFKFYIYFFMHLFNLKIGQFRLQENWRQKMQATLPWGKGTCKPGRSFIFTATYVKFCQAWRFPISWGNTGPSSILHQFPHMWKWKKILPTNMPEALVPTWELAYLTITETEDFQREDKMFLPFLLDNLALNFQLHFFLCFSGMKEPWSSYVTRFMKNMQQRPQWAARPSSVTPKFSFASEEFAGCYNVVGLSYFLCV